jgi:hypothetical protein
MTRQLAIIILLSFIFTACSPVTGPAAAPMALTQPVVLPSPTPVLVDNSTPAATFAPVALETLAPKGTQPPTLTPSPAPTRTPTLDPTYALAPKLPFQIDCNEQYRSYSPDEEWVAFVCLTDRGYAVTQIYSLDGLQVWKLQPTLAERNARPVEYTYLQPFHWIVTGQYLYLVGHTCCREVRAKWYSGYNLTRLDLVTGKLETIIDGLPGFNAYHFGFSEGEGFLMIFDMTNNFRLRFITLYNSFEQNIYLPQAARFVGNEIWAPYGYEMALEGCTSSDLFKVTCDTYSIYLVNFNESKAEVLVWDTSTLHQANGERKPVEISKIEWEDGYNLRVYDIASEQNWEVSVLTVWPTATEEIWKPTLVTPENP